MLMFQNFMLAALVERSSGSYAETDLSKTLADLPPLGVHGPWLAGGALRRTLLGQPVQSDFDFFFASREQLAQVAVDLSARGFIKVKETNHHEHWRGQAGGKERDVQLIRFLFYPTAESVIESFDFTICQFVTDGTLLITGDCALWDLGRKRLVLHKLTYPVSTMRRLLKYQKQGYYACGGVLAAILRETINSPELHMQLDTEYVD